MAVPFLLRPSLAPEGGTCYDNRECKKGRSIIMKKLVTGILAHV